MSRGSGRGLNPATLVHPSACLGAPVELGPGSVVCAGSILKSDDDHVRGLTTAAGIWLTAAALLGRPAAEVTDQEVALEELWGPAATHLTEQLQRPAASSGALAQIE